MHRAFNPRFHNIVGILFIHTQPKSPNNPPPKKKDKDNGKAKEAEYSNDVQKMAQDIFFAK